MRSYLLYRFMIYWWKFDSVVPSYKCRPVSTRRLAYYFRLLRIVLPTLCLDRKPIVSKIEKTLQNHRFGPLKSFLKSRANYFRFVRPTRCSPLKYSEQRLKHGNVHTIRELCKNLYLAIYLSQNICKDRHTCPLENLCFW
jgi:hypothetical protein